MRRLRLLLVLLLVAAALAACRQPSPTPQNGDNPLGLFGWDTDPGALIVRLDAYTPAASPAETLNHVPPCTVWGDGRVVWTSPAELIGHDVLEARIDEDTLRGFIESIIGRGFYTWEDEPLVSLDQTPILQSITVSLYGDVRTVRRAENWPQNSFERILDECRRLSPTPVLVMPSAGWVSAYPITLDISRPSWPWPRNAPFSLRELAESGQARWLEGELAAEIWQSARETNGATQGEERGAAYTVAIVVPGYSREGPVATSDELSGATPDVTPDAAPD